VKFKKICVIGLGYIGLPTAATFATHGIKVHGVDVNPHVIETLSRGGIHIHEPGLHDVVEKAIRDGNLTVSTEPVEADAFIIAVPTPFQEDTFGEYNGQKYKLADMRAVTSAAEAIVPHLRKGNLVILESTSPPRTTIGLIAPILERSKLKAGSDFFLCYSPERVLPGQIMSELIENARVIGGITPESAKAGHELYATFVKGPFSRPMKPPPKWSRLWKIPRAISTSQLPMSSPALLKNSAWMCGKPSVSPTCTPASTSSARDPVSVVTASASTRGFSWKPRRISHN
jgi:UDP-N-acetyl-D-mannosaminuronic acid dehydrogenase